MVDLPPEGPPTGPPPPTLAQLAGPFSAYFVVLAVCFVVLGGLAQLVDLPFGIWFSEVGLLFLPVVLFLRANNLAPLKHLGLTRGLATSTLVLVLLVAGANYLFAAGAMGILDQVLPKSWHLVDVEKILTMVHGWRLGLVLFAVVFLAPLCEETAFRGLLQQPLVARLGPVWGIGITAVAFSALHMDPIGFLPRLELGILFGWLYLRTGSLWASMLAHAVNNGVAAVLFIVAGGGHLAAGATAPASGMRSLVGLIGLGILLGAPLVVALHRHLGPVEPRRLHRLDPDRPIRLRPGSPEAIVLGILAVLTLLLLVVAVGALAVRAAHAGA